MVLKKDVTIFTNINDSSNIAKSAYMLLIGNEIYHAVVNSIHSNVENRPKDYVFIDRIRLNLQLTNQAIKDALDFVERKNIFDSNINIYVKDEVDIDGIVSFLLNKSKLTIKDEILLKLLIISRKEMSYRNSTEVMEFLVSHNCTLNIYNLAVHSNHLAYKTTLNSKTRYEHLKDKKEEKDNGFFNKVFKTLKQVLDYFDLTKKEHEKLSMYKVNKKTKYPSYVLKYTSKNVNVGMDHVKDIYNDILAHDIIPINLEKIERDNVDTINEFLSTTSLTNGYKYNRVGKLVHNRFLVDY